MNKGKNTKIIERNMNESKIISIKELINNLQIFNRSTDRLALLKKQLRFKYFEFQLYLSSKFAPNKLLHIKLQKPKRVLIAGHFSFPGGGGTFGDNEAMQTVCDWLTEANIDFDIASNSEDGLNGLNISKIDESNYGIFIFVCGPWYSNGIIQKALLKKFANCVKIGINLTTFEAGNSGFDFLLSRDSNTENNVDIAFSKTIHKLPVVGILLVDRQKNYGLKQRHFYIRKVITNYLNKGLVAPIWLDTNANKNIMNINNYVQFESIVSLTDLVVTNRLHGLVLSLKNSVPVIAIDPIIGGGKVTAQAKALGWPIVISAEDFSEEELAENVNYCLKTDLIEVINKTQQHAITSIQDTKNKFMNIIGNI